MKGVEKIEDVTSSGEVDKNVDTEEDCQKEFFMNEIEHRMAQLRQQARKATSEELDTIRQEYAQLMEETKKKPRRRKVRENGSDPQ